MELTNDAYQSFKAHVLREFPLEACGLLINGAYYECKNIHEEPKGAFRISGEERIRLELKYGSTQAVLHSHPYNITGSAEFLKNKYNPAWPSVPDQQGFMSDTVDWGIVASDGKGLSEFVWMSNEPKPLERRQFAWFTDDCFSIVRDWYALNTDIRLPNFTRPWEFWREPINNVIEEGLATIPFATKLPTEKAQVGDAVAFAVVGSPIVNHVGVIVGENELLHIFPNEGYYAHTVRWDLWKHKARFVVRFTK